ncbi:glycosyltransferase family 87 protein [Micromonospora sp. NBC_01796]|uniref:glycosyltransferase family 87 protein n=1 Tax=Micromonospora sp. NBC_01796 TaxID=2975987 RepID=UPI002DD9F4DE|nr:glycosyltransferase family 87 protein [Micromonospora sp. NBC_01796]WSA87313.1 glycosyltransferase 87 family protein [Micromonospora sp. NBC_01796]
MPADPAASPTTTADDPGGRTARWLVVAVALAAVVPVIYLLGTPHNFFDLKIYMSAMRWWANGNPLYDYAQPDRVQGELYFTYPPFTALLMRPFAGLPLGATVTIFTIFTVLAVIVTTWWLIMSIADRRGFPRWLAAVVAIPLVFAAESTRETITFGQINMLLVVLILGDLLFAVPRNSRWAGVGVGLATALKLYPGIFIIYFLTTRRWREAAVASASAAVATLLAAAIAPGDSWRFWTHELWATGRVGRTDYTGNQSLFGLLSRITVPEKPDQLLWLALVAVVGGFGLWRASRAARGGDELSGLALTGLVGALASPISWTHHVYWFIPAVLVLADAGLAQPPGWEPTGLGRRRRRALLVLAGVVYASVVYGVVSFHDWGVKPVPTDSPIEFVLRNMYVLLAVLLLVVLPTRHLVRAAPTNSVPRSGVPVTR